jgi:hypothetical protein
LSTEFQVYHYFPWSAILPGLLLQGTFPLAILFSYKEIILTSLQTQKSTTQYSPNKHAATVPGEGLSQKQKKHE